MSRKDPNRRPTRRGSREGSASNGSGRDSSAKAGASSSSSAPKHRGRRGARASDKPFVLFVEGARDREFLATWARRASPTLVRCIEQNTVILGGRQPARAFSEFQKRGGAEGGLCGLIVLDRDDLEGESAEALEHAAAAEAGLELFVWSLRHIESYLLVPSAIRRVLGHASDDPRVERILSSLLEGASTSTSTPTPTPTPTPTSSTTSEHARGSIHAKRILGPGGSLSDALGADLNAGEIARAMVTADLHADIERLFARIGALSGLTSPGPEVVVRRAPPQPAETTEADR